MVAIGAMGVATARISLLTLLELRGELRGEAQCHRECFAREAISGYQYEVLLASFLVPWLELICVPGRSMRVHLLGNRSTFRLFVKCLGSLPNLHTLEMGWVAHPNITTLLQSALKGVKLPQIKTLILPPSAYPLLQPCRNVEDVACVVGYTEGPCDEFIKSLTSNRHPRVKRLAVPLTTQVDSSRK